MRNWVIGSSKTSKEKNHIQRLKHGLKYYTIGHIIWLTWELLALGHVFSEAAKWELEASFLGRCLMNTATKWLLVKRQLQRAWQRRKPHVQQSLGAHYETRFIFTTQYETITSNLGLMSPFLWAHTKQQFASIFLSGSPVNVRYFTTCPSLLPLPAYWLFALPKAQLTQFYRHIISII